MAVTTYHHGDLKNALIQAGMEILVSEGLAGLSLRKVAKQAGVSHTAPYAHFADKQALIAAISTEGFRQLYERIATVAEAHRQDPRALLVETTWAYVQFARSEPDRFKLMFSSALEKEKDYPEFVAVSQETFAQLVDIVRACQAGGVVEAGAADQVAVRLWSTVHGFTSLLLEGQIPHSVLNQAPLKELVTGLLPLAS